MRKLAEILQSHPAIVIAMFLVAVVSGAMQILLGWTQLYRDFLALEVRVPVWVLLLMFIFGGLAYFLARLLTARRATDLETVAGKSFGVERVELDGKHFMNCDFEGTALVFSGTAGFSLSHSNFRGPRFVFERYAANTLAQLRVLRTDPALRAMIDGML